MVSILGMNVSTQDFVFLEWVLYLFHLSFFLFLALEMYIKDIRYSLDTIFIRMKETVWWCRKTISFLILVFLLLLGEYSILTLLLFLQGFTVSISTILSFFFTYFFYIVCIQFMALLFYLLMCLTEKTRFVFSLLILLFLLFFPKQVVYFSDRLYLLVLFFFSLFLILDKIFLYKKRKIIQKLGGV